EALERLHLVSIAAAGHREAGAGGRDDLELRHLAVPPLSVVGGLRHSGGQTSTSASSSFAAFSWMNLKRSSGRRPISASISSEVFARSSGGRTTLSSVRRRGSMVVSLREAGGISPRPLKRLISTR